MMICIGVIYFSFTIQLTSVKLVPRVVYAGLNFYSEPVCPYYHTHITANNGRAYSSTLTNTEY